MDRLTKRNKEGTGYYYPKCFKKCKGYGSSSKCDKCDLSIESCNKLGEYEETGLTPDQIYQINELYSEQAKELMEYRKRGIDKIAYKEGYNKAIDDFMEKVKEIYAFTILEEVQLEKIAEQLKAGGKNESK